jgi:hypothetical protein
MLSGHILSLVPGQQLSGFWSLEIALINGQLQTYQSCCCFQVHLLLSCYCSLGPLLLVVSFWFQVFICWWTLGRWSWIRTSFFSVSGLRLYLERHLYYNPKLTCLFEIVHFHTYNYEFIWFKLRF